MFLLTTHPSIDKYKDIFPNFKIIRNNKNIGLSSNILGAKKMLNKKSMWWKFFDIYLFKKNRNPNVSYNTLELFDGWISITLILEKNMLTNCLNINYVDHKLYCILGAIML